MIIKQNLDYFRLNSTKSTAIRSIMMECGGQKAFGTIISLYQFIYSKNGYYFEVNTQTISEFSYLEHVEPNFVRVIIKQCVRYNIFDRDKFEKYHILTNEEIQDNYYDVVQRRKVVKVNFNYLTDNFVTLFKNLTENANISKQNANISKQKIQDEKETKQTINLLSDGAMPAVKNFNNEESFLLFERRYPDFTDTSILPENIDMQKILFEFDNSSKFLQTRKNLKLSFWTKKENYLKLISGTYRNYTPKIEKTLENQRTYTKSELSDLFTDLNDPNFTI